MKDIDEMDMLGFIKLRAWEARQEYARKHTIIKRKVYIDDVWPSDASTAVF